jgi:hypothetical protein
LALWARARLALWARGLFALRRLRAPQALWRSLALRWQALQRLRALRWQALRRSRQREPARLPEASLRTPLAAAQALRWSPAQPAVRVAARRVESGRLARLQVASALVPRVLARCFAPTRAGLHSSTPTARTQPTPSCAIAS